MRGGPALASTDTRRHCKGSRMGGNKLATSEASTEGDDSMGHVAHSRSTWPHGKWVSLATPSQKTTTHLFLHLRTSRLVVKIANRLHVGEVVQTCKEYAQSVRLGE